MPIQKCAEILQGYDEHCPSGNFGLKGKGDTGRNGNNIAAILLRCIPEGYCDPCCLEGNLKKDSDEYRTSYHYVVKADGTVIKDVEETDTSWALKPKLVQDLNALPIVTYNVEYPECKTIDWDILNTPPPVGYKDDLLLTIGIEVPKLGTTHKIDWGHKGCGCAENCRMMDQYFSSFQLYKLARLMKWLVERHPVITLDKDHIQFFQNINDCCIDECGCAPQVEELVCLVQNYCEPVKNNLGQSILETAVSHIYGFNEDGMPVKEPIHSALKRLILWDNATNKPVIKLPSGLTTPLDTI